MIHQERSSSPSFRPPRNILFKCPPTFPPPITTTTTTSSSSSSSLMPSLRTSRTALAHAILATIHPSIAHNTHFPFPVPLPSELHLLIRTHLRVHIAHALLEALHASLSTALSALCDDCKSYHAHVFGPHVADWPVIRAGRGCRCPAIGLPPTPPSWKTDRDDNACLEHDIPPRPPVGDRDPPAYFLAHVQQTLATYASMDPTFPYADKPIISSADIDTLISRVLATFGWTAIPVVSYRKWEFDNEVLIVPLSASPPGDIPAIALEDLQLRLDLPIHDDILARSILHPTKVTYFPPLPPPSIVASRYSFNPLSTSLVSALVLFIATSPIALAYALHLTVSSHT